jgi:hypothetical protein
MSQKSSHYIDNAKFYAEMAAHVKACKIAKKKNLKKPQIPRYVGECFIKIATNLSSKPNFASYTYREEMVGDAIENCVMYCENFDPEKSKNPFAYFTQIVYFAFLRRLEKEKKQLYVKYKSTEQVGLLEEFSSSMTNDGSDNDPRTQREDMYENLSEFIETYESKMKAKKLRKPKNLLSIIEGTDEPGIV